MARKLTFERKVLAVIVLCAISRLRSNRVNVLSPISTPLSNSMLIRRRANSGTEASQYVGARLLDAQDARKVQELQAKLQIDSQSVSQALLQRCLRAVKSNVAEASGRARKIVKWRHENDVDTILETREATVAEEWYRKLLHYGITGVDRLGRPVMIEAVGQWDLEAINIAAQFRQDEMLLAHIAVCEMLLQKSESVLLKADEPITRVPGFVAVLDMAGLRMKQNPLAYPQVLAALKAVSGINSAYYPEAVEHVFIVNAPRFFAAIWKVLSAFVLPSSGTKVDVLTPGKTDVLLEAVGPNCLPKQLGGSLPSDTPPYES